MLSVLFVTVYLVLVRSWKAVVIAVQSVQLYMTDIDIATVRIGLRNWPVDITSLEAAAIKDESEELYLREGDDRMSGFKQVLWTEPGNKKGTTVGLRGLAHTSMHVHAYELSSCFLC